MNETEFWGAYETVQSDITLSDEVKRMTVERATAVRDPHFTTGHEIDFDDVAQTPQSSPIPTQRRIVRRFVLASAACLAVIAIAAGIISFDNFKTHSGMPGSNVPDFILQAYASGIDTILAMGNDNQIIFDRIPYSYMDSVHKEYYDEEGCYTGCLFRVEGEGITRIQASVSTGVLYRYTTEDLKMSENEDRLLELASWKPTARGTGKYYGAYDYVHKISYEDGLDKNDPNKVFRIGLIKQLGSTIDVSVDENSLYSSFGFWTNEDYGDVPDGPEALDAVVDLFDGAMLTVTVTFEDGHTTTQMIELCAADVKASFELRDEIRVTVLTPEIVDTDGLTQYEDYIHTLYGVVQETNNSQFPGSLENANEIEHIVTDYMKFERQDLLWPTEIDLSKIDFLTPSDPAPFSFEYTIEHSVEYGVASISNIVMLDYSKQLPSDTTLDDLHGGFQNWEYFNRVTSQIDGYTIDEAGTPSNGFSWVVMEADITNNDKVTATINGSGSHLGSFMVVDGDDVVSGVLCRSFSYTQGSSELVDQGSCYALIIEPGETKTLRWLVILPDSVINDPSLFFRVGSQDDIKGVKLEVLNR